MPKPRKDFNVSRFWWSQAPLRIGALVLGLALGCSKSSAPPAPAGPADTTPRPPEPDTVPLARWSGERPKTPEDAVALGRKQKGDQWRCPEGIESGTCDGLKYVVIGGGGAADFYYFDSQGLVGVRYESDVPMRPTRFGTIPPCKDPVVTSRVCAAPKG